MPFAKDDKGSAVVEVTILLPIILMLVFGFIFFTQAIRVNTVLNVAAREGAREFAITHSSSRAIAKAKEELAIGGINPNDATVTTYQKGYERSVRVELPYFGHIAFVGKYPLMLKGEMTFHQEPYTTYW